MQSTVRVSIADIRPHIAKKRVAIDVGSSRMTKKSRVDFESVPTRESDIPSVIAESIIALSASTMLLPVEVSSVRVETARDENAAPKPPAVLLAGV